MNNKKVEHIILEKSIVMCSYFYMQIQEVFTMKKIKNDGYARTKKEVRHNPTLKFGKRTFLY